MISKLCWLIILCVAAIVVEASPRQVDGDYEILAEWVTIK